MLWRAGMILSSESVSGSSSSFERYGSVCPLSVFSTAGPWTWPKTAGRSCVLEDDGHFQNSYPYEMIPLGISMGLFETILVWFPDQSCLSQLGSPDFSINFSPIDCLWSELCTGKWVIMSDKLKYYIKSEVSLNAVYWFSQTTESD